MKETPPPNGVSETTESTTSSISSITPVLSHDRDGSSASSNGRLPLTLPIPGALIPSQSRSQQSLPFDRVSESTSPHLAHHPKREAPFEELASNRLPSITPHGVLIENGTRDVSPNYHQSASTPAHVAAESYSPPTGSSYGSGSPGKHADTWTRRNPSSAFGLSDLEYQPQSHPAASSHATATLGIAILS